MASDFGSDPWIDARLRDVPLPAGVLARLEQIASTSDDDLDATVRDVPLPADLLARLQRIPRLHRRHIPWREMALAASLLAAAVISLLSVPLRRVHDERSSGDGAQFVGAGAPLTVAAKDSEGTRPRQAGEGIFVPGVDSLPLADGWSAEAVAAKSRAAKPTKPAEPATVTPLAASAEIKPDAQDDSSSEQTPRQGGILAAPRGSDRLPRLELVSHGLDRGLAPPLVAGYDFVFQLKTGERPFVSPETNPLLASSPVPLVRNKSSYLLARDAIAGGHLPPADDVRIEDFLAAVDDLFPPSNQPLALHLLAGPAPFGESGLQLLQVGLRVGGPTGIDPATGARRMMAQGATLTVAFNPKVVQAYRLVGHATTTLTGPVAGVTQVDLTAGTDLSGLFELWLKADGGNDVATVDLAWHEPNSSTQRHLGGRIARPQFAKSFADASPSLQAAALAAETARVLRSHALAGRSLARVLDMAAQVKPQLRKEPSFAELVQLATGAEKVRANPNARRAAADSEP